MGSIGQKYFCAFLCAFLFYPANSFSFPTWGDCQKALGDAAACMGGSEEIGASAPTISSAGDAAQTSAGGSAGLVAAAGTAGAMAGQFDSVASRVQSNPGSTAGGRQCSDVAKELQSCGDAQREQQRRNLEDAKKLEDAAAARRDAPGGQGPGGSGGGGGGGEGQGGGGGAIAAALVGAAAAIGPAIAAAIQAGADVEVAKTNAEAQEKMAKITAENSKYLADQQKQIAEQQAAVSKEIVDKNNAAQSERLDMQLANLKIKSDQEAALEREKARVAQAEQLRLLAEKKQTDEAKLALAKQQQQADLIKSGVAPAFSIASSSGTTTPGGANQNISVTRTFQPKNTAGQSVTFNGASLAFKSDSADSKKTSASARAIASTADNKYPLEYLLKKNGYRAIAGQVYDMGAARLAKGSSPRNRQIISAMNPRWPLPSLSVSP